MKNVSDNALLQAHVTSAVCYRCAQVRRQADKMLRNLQCSRGENDIKKQNNNRVNLKLVLKIRKPFSKAVNAVSLQATTRNKSSMDVMTARTPSHCTHLPAAQQPDAQP